MSSREAEEVADNFAWTKVVFDEVQEDVGVTQSVAVGSGEVCKGVGGRYLKPSNGGGAVEDLFIIGAFGGFGGAVIALLERFFSGEIVDGALRYSSIILKRIYLINRKITTDLETVPKS